MFLHSVIAIPHISSLYSISWVSWVMFALLALFFLNPMLNSGIGVVLRSVFTRSERIYTVAARNWLNEITLRVFRIGILAMALLLVVFPVDHFSYVSYAKALGVCAAVYAVQSLLVHMVGYVFVSVERMNAALEQYSGIRTLVCIVLYPILLLLTNISSFALPKWLCGFVAVCYVGIVLYKCMQLFFSEILSILYIFLYVICLEIFPLAGCIYLAQHIV